MFSKTILRHEIKADGYNRKQLYLPCLERKTPMKRTLLHCMAVFFFVPLLSLSPIEISLNGSFLKEYPPRDLSRSSYTLPGAPPAKGLVLSELLPPLYEAWKIEITGKHTSDSLRISSFPETINRSALIESAPGVWDLHWFDGTIYREIRSMDIAGEELLSNTLEVWISWEGTKELKQEIDAFAADYGLDINTTVLPDPAGKYLSILRGGGEVPDLIMVSAGDMNRLVRTEALQTIPGWISSSLDSRGNRTFQTGCSQWAAPFYYDTQIIFYNPDFIDLSGYPDLTISQLKNLAAALQNRVEVPLSWNAYSINWLIPFQRSFGKEGILNPDRSITVNDRPTREALEYLVDLTGKEYFRPLERDAMTSYFATGKGAVIFSASYAIPLFQELGIPYGIAGFPVNEATGKPVSPLLDFKAFAITRKSRNPLLAQKLISHLTGIGVQQTFPVALSKLPANTEAAQLVQDWNPHYRVLLESAAKGTVIPSEKAFTVYKNIMWKLLRFALSGQLSPEQVLARGQSLLDEELKNSP